MVPPGRFDTTTTFIGARTESRLPTSPEAPSKGEKWVGAVDNESDSEVYPSNMGGHDLPRDFLDPSRFIVDLSSTLINVFFVLINIMLADLIAIEIEN